MPPPCLIRVKTDGKMFKRSSKGVSRELQGYFKKFIGCFKKVCKVCYESFKATSRKLEGCLKDD